MSVGALDGTKDCTELYSAVNKAVGDDDDRRVTDGKVGILVAADGLTLFTVGTYDDGILDEADTEGKKLGALDGESLGTVECTIVGHVEVAVLGCVDLIILGASEYNAIGSEDGKLVASFDGKLLVVVDGNIVLVKLIKQVGSIDCNDDCKIDGDKLDLNDEGPIVIVIDGIEAVDVGIVISKVGTKLDAIRVEEQDGEALSVADSK